jgi:RNA polymerase sigma factor (sigma-70 family)
METPPSDERPELRGQDTPKGPVMTAVAGVLGVDAATQMAGAVAQHQEGLAGLLAAAQRGDADAFARIVRQFEGPTYHFILRMVRRTHVAEDIAQDVFIRLWRHLDEIESPEMLQGWLRRVAANAVVDHWRKEEVRVRRLRSMREHPIARRVIRPSTRMESREALDTVQAALKQVPAKLRSILLLRTVEGLRYEELAEMFGISVHAVRSRLFRARQQLLEALKHASAADHLARLYAQAVPEEEVP